MTTVYNVLRSLRAACASSLAGDAYIPPHPTPRHLAVPRAPPASTALESCNPNGPDHRVALPRRDTGGPFHGAALVTHGDSSTPRKRRSSGAWV